MDLIELEVLILHYRMWIKQYCNSVCKLWPMPYIPYKYTQWKSIVLTPSLQVQVLKYLYDISPFTIQGENTFGWLYVSKSKSIQNSHHVYPFTLHSRHALPTKVWVEKFKQGISSFQPCRADTVQKLGSINTTNLQSLSI